MAKVYLSLFFLVLFSGFSYGVPQVASNGGGPALPYESKSIADSDYVDAYFVVYGDVISGGGRFSQKELNDVVLYYLSNDEEALSDNLLDSGPNSGESIDSILTRAGARFGSRRSYCYITTSINDLPCCVDWTVKRGYCYEYKKCRGGVCVDIDCSRYTCGDGRCQWGEGDVNSPCCCAADCGVRCSNVTTTTSGGTTTTGVTTTTRPSGKCAFPDGSPVPWVCGDGVCDVVGRRFWRLSENNPRGPCCCEADCRVKCSGSNTTTTSVGTTTTVVTTTTLPSGSCAFPDGSPVPWVCGDGVCDWIGGRYWYLSENNPRSPCCCEADCWVRCRGGTTTTTSGTTTTSQSTSTSTTQGTTTTSSGTTSTAGSTTTTTTSTGTTTTTATTSTTGYVTSTSTSTTTTSSSTTTSSTTPQTPCDVYKTTGKLPSSWDLRNVNGVNYITPVRDQGNCGSCWAFGAIGAMEGTYNFEQNKSTGIDLSEQDIVSCDNTNHGCSGGFSSKVYVYLESSAMCDETCFPYQAADLSCSQRCAWNKNGWKISSDERPNTVEAAKARLICGGPIAVCSSTWGHCITLIAYDDSSSICQTQYGTSGCWIIKNSWGIFNGVEKYCGVYHESGYGYIPYSGHQCSDIVEGSTSYDMPAAPVGIIAP